MSARRPTTSGLLSGVVLVLALGISGCNCGWFALDEYRCDGPGADCGAGMECVQSEVTDEFFCVVAGDASVGTDSFVNPDAACFCDDGDPCNGVETCDADNNCVPGMVVDCSSLDDACNMGTCDSSSGNCVATPLPDGTTCDDGLFCTEPDGCEMGVCTGPPRDCSGAGDICNSGGCDEAMDMCTGLPLPDGDPCNDGMFCTVGETCQSSVCTGGMMRDCSALEDQCNGSLCNEMMDVCEPDPLPNTTMCDDGVFCTMGDTCSGGVCTGGPPPDCTAMDSDCTVGVCDEIGMACAPMPTNETMPCDDGVFCTDGTTCTSGVCSGGMVTDCSASGDQCNMGFCNMVSDMCDTMPLTGTLCDDGSGCTDPDMCNAGVCMGTPMCEFVCDGSCVLPSNVTVADLLACDSSAPALTPPGGSTITVSDGMISCTDCDGMGTTSIPVLNTIVQGGGDPDISVFCLSAMSISGGLTVNFTGTNAVAFIVDGTVIINGTLDGSGGDADVSTGGAGGPGGYDGLSLTDFATAPAGNGPCAGDGGTRSGSVGAGGGGGGHAGNRRQRWGLRRRRRRWRDGRRHVRDGQPEPADRW